MSYLTDDISMASVNAAKVVDIDETIREAKSLLDSHLQDGQDVAAIQNALTMINQTEDYQLQPEFVQEIDEVINSVGNIVVTRNDSGPLVSGTESFGFTLTPKEWRRTRVEGCESILDELSKTMKVYTNKLSEKLSEIFTGNKYTIEGLTDRIEEAHKKLTFIETVRTDIEFVTIPENIAKALSIDFKTIATQPGIDKLIGTEVNLIGMLIKLWVQENVQYKNKLIKFFGNKGRGDFLELYRLHPKFVSKKLYIDEDNSDEVTWSVPNKLLGNGAFLFTENAHKPETLTELANSQGYVGYRIVKPSEVNYPRPIPPLNVKPISISQMESIVKTVKMIISLMTLINQPNNDFDTDGKDIKDLTNTIKSTEDEILMDAFSGMLSSYQQNVISAQGNIIRYLGEIGSTLITYLFIHMEGYDDA